MSELPDGSFAHNVLIGRADDTKPWTFVDLLYAQNVTY